MRQLALDAIAHTRFIPEKGENRIRSMVEGRPDWVISRQRAWGVPIALFVKRGGNHPLVDQAVNGKFNDLKHGDEEPAKVTVLVDRNGDGKFDLKTGAAIDGVVRKPVDTFQVEVREGMIWVGTKVPPPGGG